VRAVCQRVSEARVRIDGVVQGEIEAGLVVLVGIARGDFTEDAERLAAKIARLRIFPDDRGKFDRSVLDAGGTALVVSQFTLIADSQKGARPDFSQAARPEVAEPLYQHLVQELRRLGVPVQTGVFGAKMQLALVNDGPVTIILDVESSGGSR
jgi:D-aminoacyl-tRNA deacylase